MTTAQVRLTAHLRALVGERHPFSSTSFLQQAETYLYEQFKEAGLAVSTQEFEALGGVYRNVIGIAHPISAEKQPALPPLIIAAHYDTVPGSPGADDNASALAVLLDVAQRITQTSLCRPVHFIAFCLEEEDLVGSRAYVAHLTATRKPVYGAIILECVGYARDEEGSQKIPPGVPVAVPTVGNFLAVIGNQSSSSLTTAVEQAMRPHLPIVPLIVPGNGELLPDTRRSDHTPFWEARFPAVMLTDTANFRNPHYHRPTDTIDTLNLDFMAAVADGVTAAIFCLTETQGTP
ncbi:MAG: M28 family peptidase [Nitrospira sp.]|nr:M28 family peptidase [Nitrospira sp.]MBH0182263.1 M28 family peptidase [Nitrospira sp.]